MKYYPGLVCKDNNLDCWYLLLEINAKNTKFWMCRTTDSNGANPCTSFISESSFVESFPIPDKVMDVFAREIQEPLQMWKSIMSGFKKTEKRN